MNAEWTLVIFTVLSQLAVGLALFLALSRCPEDCPTVRKGWLTVFVASAVGLLVSLFHLGQPLRAILALAALGISWLSAEALLFGLFTVLAALTWRLGGRFARITAAVGVAGIVAQGFTYGPESLPFLAGFLPLLLFALSALVLGTAFLPVCEHQEKDPAGILHGSLWLLLAVLVIALVMGLSGGTVMRASALAWLQSPFFWIGFLCLAAALPFSGRDARARKVLPLVGVACLRVVFFSETVHTATTIGLPY